MIEELNEIHGPTIYSILDEMEQLLQHFNFMSLKELSKNHITPMFTAEKNWPIRYLYQKSEFRWVQVGLSNRLSVNS